MTDIRDDYLKLGKEYQEALKMIIELRDYYPHIYNELITKERLEKIIGR